jgi:hypothetical protein
MDSLLSLPKVMEAERPTAGRRSREAAPAIAAGQTDPVELALSASRARSPVHPTPSASRHGRPPPHQPRALPSPDPAREALGRIAEGYSTPSTTPDGERGHASPRARSRGDPSALGCSPSTTLAAISPPRRRRGPPRPISRGELVATAELQDPGNPRGFGAIPAEVGTTNPRRSKTTGARLFRRGASPDRPSVQLRDPRLHAAAASGEIALAHGRKSLGPRPRNRVGRPAG